LIPTYFLYQLAEYEGVAVEWHDFEHIEGIYTYTPTMTTPIIALSTLLQTQERKLRCVLAHELGHHFETAGHHIIAASGPGSIYATKNEILATRWAVNLMIDTYAFLECIKDGMDKQEVANYFYVLPEFVSLKAELLKETEKYSEVVAKLNASYNVYF
jgi:Zn-dependent peptidase ImmA (M78 family)